MVLDVKLMVVEVCLLDERILSLNIMSKGIIRSFESIFGFPNYNSVLTLRGTSEKYGSSYAFCSYKIIYSLINTPSETRENAPSHR